MLLAWGGSHQKQGPAGLSPPQKHSSAGASDGPNDVCSSSTCQSSGLTAGFNPEPKPSSNPALSSRTGFHSARYKVAMKGWKDDAHTHRGKFSLLGRWLRGVKCLLQGGEVECPARKAMAESRRWSHSEGSSWCSMQSSSSPTPPRASYHHKMLLKHKGWTFLSCGVQCALQQSHRHHHQTLPD